MNGDFSLSSDKIRSNIEELRKFMVKEKVDGFYISDTDQYLNESVPLQNSHCYYFTGFTGTTATILIPSEGKVLIFVDGRYHEQADTEVDFALVEVVKCEMGVSIRDKMLDEIKMKKIDVLGLDGSRISVALKEKFAKVVKITSYNDNEIDKIVCLEWQLSPTVINYLDQEICGQNPKEKIETIQNETEGYFVSALDSIAWLTNCRASYIENKSTFEGKCFVVDKKCYVFVQKNHPVTEEALKNECLEFEFIQSNELKNRLVEITKDKKIVTISYQPSQINVVDFEILKEVFGADKLLSKPDGLVEFQAIKNENEIKQFNDSYLSSDKVFVTAINWVKNKIDKNEQISELDLFEKVKSSFFEEGAKGLSFTPIVASSVHSSIIHYTAASNEAIINKNELVLIDAGAYYKSGLSTDTTRTFLAGTEATSFQKEIYTLVLKGVLNTLSAVFPDGTWGACIDGITRMSMRKRGYDFNHGTGHGIGINVHESGTGISSKSRLPLKEGHTLSIEPGIYIPGKGGVRLEMIVKVKKHEEFDDMLCFEPLSYVGFDHNLIDQSQLNHEEKLILDDYEAICSERGTSLR